MCLCFRLNKEGKGESLQNINIPFSLFSVQLCGPKTLGWISSLPIWTEFNWSVNQNKSSFKLFVCLIVFCQVSGHNGRKNKLKVIYPLYYVFIKANVTSSIADNIIPRTLNTVSLLMTTHTQHGIKYFLIPLKINLLLYWKNI